MTEQNLVDSLKTQLNAMVKFPDQNPNPVLKMSMDGTLVYRNEAGHQIIQCWGLNLGDTMPTELVSHAKTPNDEAIELAVGNRTYSFHVVAVPEIDSINVYGTDVTAKKAITKFPDQNPNPVLKTDMQGRLLYANGAGQQIQQTWDIPLGGQMPQAIVDHASTPDDEAVELAVGEHDLARRTLTKVVMHIQSQLRG